MQVMCDVNRLTTDYLKMQHEEQYINLPLRVHNIKLEDIQALTNTILAQGRQQNAGGPVCLPRGLMWIMIPVGLAASYQAHGTVLAYLHQQTVGMRARP